MTTSNSKNFLPDKFKLESFYGLSNPSLLDEVTSLRARVWMSSGYPMTITLADGKWSDAMEDSSTHFAIKNSQGILIAASRLTIFSKISEMPQGDWFDGLTETPAAPIAYISRLVVDHSVKNCGLGYFLDSECIKLAKSKNLKSVFCEVPEYRMAGLERRGFKIVQQPKEGVVFPTLKWVAMLLPLE